MPSKGSDGKELSGAEKARKRKAALEAERKRTKPADSGPFAALPAPPVRGKTGTAGLVSWGAKCLALTMDRAIRDQSIFETERDQLKFLADCCAKLGMIRDKGAEQERIKRGLKKFSGKQDESLPDVTGPAPPPIQAPPR